MRVSDVLEAGGIVVRPPWAGFEDAVRGLVGALVERGRIAPDLLEETVRAVCERERLATTTIVEIGVRIPHARVAGIKGVMAALAVSPTAVYQGKGEVPISIMALVLSEPDLAAEHLNMLAGLSMLLQSLSVRRGLRQATDRTSALAILRTFESR